MEETKEEKDREQNEDLSRKIKETKNDLSLALKNKSLRWLIAVAMMVFICGILLLIMMALIIKDNSKCSKNPFTYGANIIIDKNRDEVATALCSCSVGDKTLFYFDKEGVYEDNPLGLENLFEDKVG